MDKKTKFSPIEADRRIWLSGTPILNRPIELWPILRVADPEGLGASHWGFARKFCKAWQAPWGWDFSGASNLDELQARLRASIMIRRLKKDVLSELPPKRRQVVAIPAEKAANVVQAELNFFEKMDKQAKISEVVDKLDSDPSIEYEEAVTNLGIIHKVPFEEISRLRHQTAVAKIPYIIEYLENMLLQEDKIVVFAHHHDVIDAIMKKFGNIAVEFHGKTKMDARESAVEKFQGDPACRLFVGSITAAGVGITLTAASYVLFAEIDWRPAIVTQAEDRLHRIGQSQSVNIQHLVFDGSLDANMAQKIIEKQAVIDAALG